MKRYREEKQTEYPHMAEVTLAQQEQLHVVGHTGLRGIKQVMPYGICAVPTEGETVLVMPTQSGEYVLLGTVFDTMPVESGEIRLCSEGGAEIILKNNGEISLNGLIINAKGEMQTG